MPQTVTQKLIASHLLDATGTLVLLELEATSGTTVQVKLSRNLPTRHRLSPRQRDILLAGGIINHVRHSHTASGT